MDITITNNSNENIAFRYFKVNMVQTLQPKEFVKITVNDGDEEEYYLNLASENLSVEVEDTPVVPAYNKTQTVGEIATVGLTASSEVMTAGEGEVNFSVNNTSDYLIFINEIEYYLDPHTGFSYNDELDNITEQSLDAVLQAWCESISVIQDASSYTEVADKEYETNVTIIAPASTMYIGSGNVYITLSNNYSSAIKFTCDLFEEVLDQGETRTLVEFLDEVTSEMINNLAYSIEVSVVDVAEDPAL